jgi:hypothetical protein
MMKKTAKTKKEVPSKDAKTQLSELQDWIEEQIQIEDTRGPGVSSIEMSKAKSITSNDTKSKGKHYTSDVDTSLPGNNILSSLDDQKYGARENRFGLLGDNGYSDMVREQRRREGLPSPSLNESDNVLNFTKKESSPVKSDKKSDISVDLKPVKGEKRKIVNQPLSKKSKSAPPKAKMPGVVNAKEEAQRQIDETKDRESKAATVMQKWYRGWRARKLVSKKRRLMKDEIDYEHARFTQEFKINEKFNLNKFISQK